VSPQPGSYKLWINGRQSSWLPFAWLHTIVGALPALAHPEPAEVAVIGLGSGDTAWASACRAETQRVTIFEIASATPRLLTRIATQLPDMGRLQEFLADPRMTVVKDDGRRRLRADGKRYDIIVADAIDIDASMSNNLYSVEFYRLVANSLKPGGLVCVLARTPRIRAALRRSLPYTLEFGREDLLLASTRPIDADSDLWLARLHSPRVVEYFGTSRLWEIEMFINQASYGRAAPPTAEANTDLEPRDEFMRPAAAVNPPRQ
jgi:SAM-dependent methyltransferase